MSLARSSTQYMGVRAVLPPDLQLATRNPTSNDKAYVKGTFWLNTAAAASFQWSGTAWVSLGSGSTGAINTLTGGSGGALSPTAGNMNLLGTANQITSTGSGSTITFSLPSAVIAPGSIASTTSITAGTTLTATSGAITATSGNFVSSASGNGLLLNSPTATGAAASPLVLNGRSGAAIFTTVSIAAAADLTLTITNSAITGSTTQVIYCLSGVTTGAALSIKSVTNSAGSSAVVVTNGTGATTSTSNITLTFLVLN